MWHCLIFDPSLSVCKCQIEWLAISSLFAHYQSLTTPRFAARETTTATCGVLSIQPHQPGFEHIARTLGNWLDEFSFGVILPANRGMWRNHIPTKKQVSLDSGEKNAYNCPYNPKFDMKNHAWYFSKSFFWHHKLAMASKPWWQAAMMGKLQQLNLQETIFVPNYINAQWITDGRFNQL